MKKFFCFAIVAMLGLPGFAQIKFEPGYIINNNGERLSCLIKNIDWKYTPSSFSYKLTDNETVREGNVEDIAEFGLDSGVKMQRFTVDLDNSSDLTGYYSKQREPEFSRVLVFLNVLVEGKANLYCYAKDNQTRFFCKTESTDLEPLVCKYYMVDGVEYKQNDLYKRQIIKALAVPTSEFANAYKLKYTSADLVRYFERYNRAAAGQPAATVQPQLEATNGGGLNPKRKTKFNLTLRPGISVGKFEHERLNRKSSSLDFGSKASFQAGIELEAVLPFNKNKFSIILEPTYQGYNGTCPDWYDEASVSLKAITLPIGVRYYMYLTDNSKLFINACFVLNLTYNSSLKTDVMEREIDRIPNLAAGIGYTYRNRFSVEVRHNFKRGAFNVEDEILKTTFSSTSFSLGYRLFTL